MGASGDYLVLTDSVSGDKTYILKKQILAIVPTKYGIAGSLYEGAEVVYGSGRSVIVRESSDKVIGEL